MTVYIITFDGTASQAATNFEISENPTVGDPNPTLTNAQRRTGGGFPANVAQRLTRHDPNTWKWIPIDYKPGFRLQNILDPNATFDIPQKNGSIGRALAMLGATLYTIPAGAKIVLSGLSQGAWVASLAFEEFRHPQGQFHYRWNDLVAVINFGSPRRPYGHHIPLPGAIMPSGQGVADYPHELSFGSVPGLVDDPPEWMWDFCMINDAAGDGVRSGPLHDAQAAVAESLWDGEIGTGIRLIPHLAAIVADLGGTILWEQISPQSDNPFALSKWLPFTTGAGEGADARLGNPHAQYNSYAYTSILNSPIVGGAEWAGTWNAATNTPTLSNATGTAGRVYQVNTSGTRNLGAGNVSYVRGEYIIHSGGAWVKATRNLTGGTAAWQTAEPTGFGGQLQAGEGTVLSPKGRLLSSPGGKTAVDLAVEYLIGVGNEYASEPVASEAPRLGFTWWQTPPD